MIIGMKFGTLFKRALWVSSTLTILSCATGVTVENPFKSLQHGAADLDILLEFGAPENIMKISDYDVWTYNQVDQHQACQIFFKENRFEGTVRCTAMTEVN